MKRDLRMFALACIAALLCGAALAQDFPKRAVTIIVPFPAGGGGNLSRRRALTVDDQKAKLDLVVQSGRDIWGDL
jgi:tripartite-type tricarboxylate transporter receptor subunit TctC